MSTTMDASKIFAPLDAERLQAQGLLSPVSLQGPRVRRCHKRRLNSSSEEEYRDIPIDVQHNSPVSDSAFATIPDALISQETLIYIGLSEDRATELWNSWTNWPSFGPRREIDPDNGYDSVSFIDFIVSPLDNHPNVGKDEDERWVECLNACGLSTNTQDAIMDPNFKNVRLTESCIFWVKDTIYMRYAGLKEIQRASREREMQIQRAARREGETRGGTSGSSSSQAQQGQGGSRASPAHGQRSISGTQRENTPGISSHFWNSDYANRLRDDVQNHVVLFKGIDLARIRNLLHMDGTINELGNLVSSPPTDFESLNGRFYFAKEYPVAEYYAAYAKRRSNCESVVMVVLTLPKDVMETLEEPELHRLYWGPRWKQIGWYSRLGNASLPQPLRKYRKAMLIIGHIAKGSSEQYEDMESWEEITDGFTLRVPPDNGNIAVQYAFSADDDAIDFLKEHGKIEVFRFSHEDIRALLRRYT